MTAHDKCHSIGRQLGEILGASGIFTPEFAQPQWIEQRYPSSADYQALMLQQQAALQNMWITSQAAPRERCAYCGRRGDGDQCVSCGAPR